MAYIKGIFIQDIYTNSTNGYTVGLLRVKESDIPEEVNKVVTFTGTFNELIYKTTYKMEGNFVEHSKYGHQFLVESYELVLPTEEEEIIDFLSSDMFPIGESTAKKIVDKLGNDAINKILENKDSLLGIPRLKEPKITKIYETLLEYQSTSYIVLELSKLGFTTKNAITLLKKYANNTMDIVNNNVYDVSEDIDISFDEIDKIARNMGYELNDERRLEALTINMMKVLTFNSGDTYLYFDEMYEYMKKHTDDLEEDIFEYILLKLTKQNKLFIDKNKYYLEEYHSSESYISSRLTKLNDMKKRKLPKLETKIKVLEDANNIIYDDSQKEAITKALNNNLTIITGGPGTGKTTIIKCIVRLLLDIYGINESKIALLAPTGRAAKKLMETTGIPAYTIHKYLAWDKEANLFQVDEYHPNKEEYIIVDESSMIDTLLLTALLKGTTLSAKYIFVGDYYQLPSVSQGQILKDMIDSNVLDVIKLNCLYRQTEGSYIINLAHEIKNKELSEKYLEKRDDYNFIPCPDSQILESIKDIVTIALEKGYHEKDIQILAPIYKTKNGIDNLNKILQEIMNKPDKHKTEITSGDTIFREGDKILQLVNDPDNFISNGDIGYIEKIIPASISKSKKNEVTINFDGTLVTYTPKDFINITHGYAISIHKSQGGEFKLVIIPFTPSFKRMLYNKLIYTAVTRAKEKLILIGSPDAFMYGVYNDYIENRKTSLKELLEKTYN
ncbi:MAG: ATP-dependent RecD-like DNA helicase [Bacilli bacterium]|nr:ATP-dependent RecD-like DNA helicase [Bacilli bacterium]